MLHSISSKIEEEMNHSNNNNSASSSFDQFSQSLSSDESNLLQPVLNGISSVKSLMTRCELDNEDQHLVTQEMLESLQNHIHQLVGSQNQIKIEHDERIRKEEEEERIRKKELAFKNLLTIILSMIILILSIIIFYFFRTSNPNSS